MFSQGITIALKNSSKSWVLEPLPRLAAVKHLKPFIENTDIVPVNEKFFKGLTLTFKT